MTAICVTLPAEGTSALIERMASLAPVADMFEVRADLVRDLAPLAILRARTKPLLFTCRSRSEGGAMDDADPRRPRLLLEAIRRGFDYVDIEHRSALTELMAAKAGRGLVISVHDFEGTPEGLDDLYAAMVKQGADVVKIAVTPHSIADVARLLTLAARVHKTGPRPLVPIAMGPLGTLTRILAGRYGAPFTFACADAEARGRSRPDRGDAHGRPLPRARGDAAHAGLRRIRGRRHAQPLAGAPQPRLRPGRDGLGIRADPVRGARALRGGTSCPGSLRLQRHEALQDGHPPVPLRYRGSGRIGGQRQHRGGARRPALRIEHRRGGRAAPASKEDRRSRVGAWSCSAPGERRVPPPLPCRAPGPRVTILARDPARAAELAAAVGGAHGDLESLALHPFDILVNATPLGSGAAPGQTPVHPSLHRRGAVVFDMVYEPRLTPLLRDAEAAGCVTIDGLQMLVAQGAAQFELWTGAKAPVDAMLQAALDLTREGGVSERYSRQERFAGLGPEGQKRMGAAEVTIIGVGALGSVLAEMMARAGVGRLTLVDRDYVEASNLQRQSLFTEEDAERGLPKAVAAAARLRASTPRSRSGRWWPTSRPTTPRTCWARRASCSTAPTTSRPASS